MNATVLQRLVDGLRVDGFHLKHTAAGPSFRGSVAVRGQQIRLRLNYQHDAYSEPPRVVVENPKDLAPGVVAHLDEDNELCVVDRNAYVADRYAAAEQARGIVAKAAEVLARAGTQAAVDEIADEFPRHWGGRVIYLDAAPFVGFVKPRTGAAWAEFVRSDKQVPSPDPGGISVVTTQRLSFHPGQSRPSTFGELLDWASSWDPELADVIVNGLARQGPADPHVFIHAPNGLVCFQLLSSQRVARNLRSLAWRQLLRGRFGQKLPIKRLQGRRVDTAYILGTNSAAGTAPLGGKRIVLVGCGAIGGFLAHALAQLGAGLDGGALLLVDDDDLSARNRVRHRLGGSHVGKKKALACKESISEDWPELQVSALPLKVEQCRSQVMGADFIVEATGEQSVGDLLNEWRIEATAAGGGPALLHAWIEGNGAVAQTYLSSDPQFGCYRCLQPQLDEAPRYPALRSDALNIVTTACGEAPFSPYGPAAPMAAASLAASHILDWSRGNGRPLLRGARLSIAETVDRKPTNPTKSDRCPACQGS